MRSALELWIQPCFSLILSVSVWISYSPSLSISQIQILCKSVGRQQLGSVPLSCAIMGGILRGSRVHITPPHVRQQCLVCTHTKVLVIFIVCCCFCEWCFLLFGAISFFFSVAWLCCLSVCLSAGCCPFHPLQIQPHDDFAFLFVSGCLGLRRQARMFGNGHLE